MFPCRGTAKSIKEFSGLLGKDLAVKVTTKKTYQWTEDLNNINGDIPLKREKKHHVVVVLCNKSYLHTSYFPPSNKKEKIKRKKRPSFFYVLEIIYSKRHFIKT